jgi:hypothetical protein
MKQARSTDLNQFTLDREQRVQPIYFFDSYAAEPEPVYGGDEDGVRVVGPFLGLTQEGHGNGIRLLIHEDVSSEECLQLLDKIAAKIREQAQPETKHPVEFHPECACRHIPY